MSRIPRIYLDLPSLEESQSCLLDKKNSHHLAQVLRLKEDSQVEVFNGDGKNYSASISVDGKTVKLNINSISTNERESSLNITSAQAISSASKMDYSIQKAVELGSKAILPVISTQSKFKLAGARLEKKLHHWQEVIISASQQCGRSVITKLHDPVSIDQLIQNYTDFDRKLILNPGHCRRFKQSDTEGKILLLAGPESGFTPAEVKSLNAGGFEEICLGKRIIRTEAALLVALGVLQYLGKDI